MAVPVCVDARAGCAGDGDVLVHIGGPATVAGRCTSMVSTGRGAFTAAWMVV